MLVICGVSDGLDGFIARVFKQKSVLGSYLDPLADKIILISAFITLGIIGFLPAWLTVVVISRDVMIMIGVILLYLTGVDINIKPVVSSKITTCLQFVTVIAVLARDYLVSVQEYYVYLYYITALFTIISFLQYLYQWLKMMGDKTGK